MARDLKHCSVPVKQEKLLWHKKEEKNVLLQYFTLQLKKKNKLILAAEKAFNRTEFQKWPVQASLPTRAGGGDTKLKSQIMGI